MDSKVLEFSVVMSIYFKDDVTQLKESINSIINQTLMPKCVILVADGNLNSDLMYCIKEFQLKFPDQFKLIKLKQNHGLWFALNKGIAVAETPLIARMDSDDIAKNNRFKLQVEAFKKNPQISVIGGQIEEFNGPVSNVISRRSVPLENEEIIKFAHRRNPMNHMTVMFKKKDFLDVGGYRELVGFEDYDLWIRMIMQKVKFLNIPQIVVHARLGNDFASRRGGYKYIGQVVRAKLSFFRIGFYTIPDLMVSVSESILSSVLPAKLRNYVYRKWIHR